MCAGLAALAPLWEPGTRLGYHALTFGWILGEVARRVDGRDFGRFVQEEIVRPLGLEGQLYFGLPDAEDAAGRDGRLGPPGPAPARAADSLADRRSRHTVAIFNRPDVRRRASRPPTG